MSDRNDDFWDSMGAMLVWHLALLDVGHGDVEHIVADIMMRCIEATKSLSVVSMKEAPDFERSFGALMVDLASAEQRLIEARTGQLPGRLIGDWPPTPIAFEHPFLASIQRVVNQVEAEANQAKYGRRAN